MQRNLDGDLASDEFHQLENHLLTCNECRELNDRFKHLSFDLEALPDIEPPFSLVDSILPQLSTGLNFAPIPLNKVNKKPKGMYLALGSSAAAVLVGAILWPWNNPKLPDHTETSQESAGVYQKREDHQILSNNQTAMDQEKGKPSHTTETIDQSPKANNPSVAKTEEKKMSAPISKTQPKGTQQQVEKDQSKEVAIVPQAPTNRVVTENDASKKDESQESKSIDTKQASPQEMPSLAMAPAAQPKTTERTALVPEAGPMQPKLQSTPVQGVQKNNTLTANNQSTANYPSPDGQKVAAISDQTIVIRNLNGSLLFQGHRFEQVDQVHPYWLDNQQLIYELYRSTGMERWRINLINGQEQKE